MARPRSISSERQRAAFIQAGQREIARGRLLYRLRLAHDGRWAVEGCPWLALDAASRGEARGAARAVIAGLFDVEVSGFDVEIVETTLTLPRRHVRV